MGVRVRSRFENQPRNKHVESNSVTCLDGGSNPPSSTNPTHDSHRLWTAVVGRADGEPRIRPAPLGKRTFPTKDTDNQRDCRCFFALWKFQVSEPRLRRLHQDAPSQNSCRNLLTILHISSIPIHQRYVRRGWRGDRTTLHQLIIYIFHTLHYRFGQELCIHCLRDFGRTVSQNL